MKRLKKIYWLSSSIFFLATLLLPLIPTGAKAATSSGGIQNLTTGSVVFSYATNRAPNGVELCIPVSGANSTNHSSYTFTISSVAGNTVTIQKFYTSSLPNCFLTNKITGTSGFSGSTSVQCINQQKQSSGNNLYTITVKNGTKSATAQISLCSLTFGEAYYTSAIVLSTQQFQKVPQVTVDASYATPDACTTNCTGTSGVPINLLPPASLIACLVYVGGVNASNPSSPTNACNNNPITLSGVKDGVFVAKGVPYGKYAVVINYVTSLDTPYFVATSDIYHTFASTSPINTNVVLTYAPGGSPSPIPKIASPTKVNTTSPTCESTNFVLSWIVCGAINLIAKAESSIEGVINNLLQTHPFNFNANPNCTGSSTSCSNQKVSAAIYSVWSNFRTYGDIVLVIALLVVVFSEAAGGGLIDAYTVRKVLPRILAAAILLNLSIYIVAGLEDVFNILGAGVINLLEAPFKAAGSGLTSSIQLSSSGSVIFSLGLVGLATATILVSGVIGIILLVVLMAFIAAIGVLITITIRQGLIVFLLMISPIAFALYVLPNTERYFKQWWSLLLKTLAVYPIVMAVFGMSFISGIIMNNLSNTGDKALSQTLALLAVVAPLFLVPFAFKMSGGAIGAIQGAMSKFTSGANKPLKKIAGREAVKGWGKTRSYGRFSDRNRLTRRVNTVLGAATHPMRDLRHGVRGIQAGRYTSMLASGAGELKEDQTFQTHQNDDNFLIALANRGLAEEKLRDAEEEYSKATTKEDKAKYQAEIEARRNGLRLADQVKSRRSAGTQLNALQALARTGYQFSDGEKGYKELQDSVRGIVGNDHEAFSSSMNTAQYFLKEAGRYELGGINNGAGYDPAAGLGKADPWSLGNRAKPSAIKAKAVLMREAFDRGDFEQAEIHRMELESVAQNATGANQKAAQEALKAHDTYLDNDAPGVVQPPAGSGLPRVTRRTSLDGWLNASLLSSRPGVLPHPTVKDREYYDTRGTWTAEDRARGYAIIERDKTNRDIAREKARGWRQPNPNEI